MGKIAAAAAEAQNAQAGREPEEPLSRLPPRWQLREERKPSFIH